MRAANYAGIIQQTKKNTLAQKKQSPAGAFALVGDY